jgi:DNA-binding transcriptional regulator YhcF (GntR family)
VILNFDSDTPIYLQIAQEIESAILAGAYDTQMQVPSTTEISVTYKINPATALKGMTKLTDDGILYKKRGVGMFVAPGAKEKILDKRKQTFFETFIAPLVSEAKKLNFTQEEIEEMIRKGLEK